MKKLLGCFLCLMLMVFLLGTLAPYDTTLAAVEKDDIREYPFAPSLGDSDVESWLEGIIGDDTDQIPYVGNSFNPGFGWTYAVVHIGGGSTGMDDLFAYEDTESVAMGDDILNPAEVLYSSGVSLVRYFGPHSVPEPATILLLGIGLVGLAGFGRKKFKK